MQCLKKFGGISLKMDLKTHPHTPKATQMNYTLLHSKLIP